MPLARCVRMPVNVTCLPELLVTVPPFSAAWICCGVGRVIPCWASVAFESVSEMFTLPKPILSVLGVNDVVVPCAEVSFTSWSLRRPFTSASAFAFEPAKRVNLSTSRSSGGFVSFSWAGATSGSASRNAASKAARGAWSMRSPPGAICGVSRQLLLWALGPFRPHRPIHALDAVGLLGPLCPLGSIRGALNLAEVQAERMGDLAPALAGGTQIEHLQQRSLQLPGSRIGDPPLFERGLSERERVVDVAEAHLLRGRIDRGDSAAALQRDGAAVAQARHQRGRILRRACEIGVALDQLRRVLRRSRQGDQRERSARANNGPLFQHGALLGGESYCVTCYGAIHMARRSFCRREATENRGNSIFPDAR